MATYPNQATGNSPTNNGVEAAGRARPVDSSVPVPPIDAHGRYYPQQASSLLHRWPDASYPVQRPEENAAQPRPLQQPIASLAHSDAQPQQVASNVPGHQPMVHEMGWMAWPVRDRHLLLTIIMTTLVLMCGDWMSLGCTLVAMVLSCCALYDDIKASPDQRSMKSRVSLVLNMAALLLMAVVWGRVTTSGEVTFGGGSLMPCAAAHFCTVKHCPFFPYSYSYHYHAPVTHAACFCYGDM